MLAFLFDLKTTLTGFGQGNKSLDSQSCESQFITVGVNESTYGCTLSENVWVGHVQKFQNVIAVALELKFHSNIDFSPADESTHYNDYFHYDLYLSTCYDNYRCGGSVNTNGSALDEWMSVITLKNEKVFIGANTRHSGTTVTLLPLTFQNQPALPDNGLAVSYLVSVVYHNATIIKDSIMTYEFVSIRRDTYIGSKILLQFCVFLTLTVIVLYVRALYSRFNSLRHALPEQRWTLYFLVALVLFQNPVYCVVSWSKRPSVGAVYAVYLMDGAAQALLFTLWLCFSDGLERQFSNCSFYVPKVTLGLMIFGVSTVVATLLLPTLTPDVQHTPVEALDGWSADTRFAFICFSISLLCLLVVWIVWWFVSIFRTAKALSKLPYMTSRYIQLWFRFFTLQATLVTLYYLFQYFVVARCVLHYMPHLPDASLESLVNGINVCEH